MGQIFEFSSWMPLCSIWMFSRATEQKRERLFSFFFFLQIYSPSDLFKISSPSFLLRLPFKNVHLPAKALKKEPRWGSASTDLSQLSSHLKFQECAMGALANGCWSGGTPTVSTKWLLRWGRS